MILGTAAYMAPEQARGKGVDKRADIWAFGVVLYEMVTGRRLFEGDEVSDVLAAVLRQEVDLTALPADTPASVRRLIARCLDRDLRRRLRDIGEARIVLDNPTSPLVADPPPVRAIADEAPPPAQASLWRRALPRAIAAASAIVAVALWAPWRAAPAATTTALQLTPLSFEQGGQTGAVWSPDGKAVAFGARQKDTDSPPRLVYASERVDYPLACLPGNRVLVRTGNAVSVEYRIVALDGRVEDDAANVSRPDGGASLRTAAGWLSGREPRGKPRCTSSRWSVRASPSRCRAAAGKVRCGRRTADRSTTAHARASTRRLSVRVRLSRARGPFRCCRSTATFGRSVPGRTGDDSSSCGRHRPDSSRCRSS
ncbi:MAG TPA: protein kinase [Vicinamibacterales bacterium]|nr:protein kinase [Vicinamibacterales bacterium]